MKPTSEKKPYVFWEVLEAKHIQLFHILFILISLIYLAGYAIGNRFSVIDDSYITYRYAQNLIDGNGLVFNVGERFYGSTAMGYALLLSVATGVVQGIQKFLGFDSLLTIARISTAISAVSMWLIWVLWYRILAGKTFSILRWMAAVTITSILYTHFYSNKVPGHETYTYFALLMLTAYLYFYQKRQILAGLSMALSFMIRPDAILFTGLISLITIIDHFYFQRKNWRDLTPKLNSFLIFGGLSLVWEIFLSIYFGSWIPETMAAKKAQVVLGTFPVFTIDNAMNAIEANTFPSFFLIAGLGIGAFIVLFVQKFLLQYDQLPKVDKNTYLMAILWILHGTGLLLAYEIFDVSQWVWYEIPIFYSFLSGLVFCLVVISVNMNGLFVNNPIKNWIFRSSTALVFLFATLAAIQTTKTHFTDPKIFLHTYSYDPVVQYLHKTEPDGTTIATPEPGALGFKLGAQYQVIDYLGLISPGVAEAIISGDEDFYYQQWQPKYILIVYTQRYAPLGLDWFEENYQLIQEFEHPWWDAKFGRGIYLYQQLDQN